MTRENMVFDNKTGDFAAIYSFIAIENNYHETGRWF